MGFGYKDAGGSDFKDSSMGYKEAKGESTSGGYGASIGYKNTTAKSGGGFGFKSAETVIGGADKGVADPAGDRRAAEASLLTQRIAEEKANSQKIFEERQVEQKRWEQKQHEMKQFLEKKAFEQKQLEQQNFTEQNKS